MATIATLDTVLRARTQKFDKDMKKSQDVVSRFSKQIKQFAVTAAAAFGATQIVSGIRNALEAFRSYGDDLDKISARTQLATSDIQSLGFALEQNGGTVNDLELAVRGLNRNWLDMQRGLTTAKDNFAALGLSIRDLEGLNTAERFRLVAERLKSVSDEGTRSGLAMKLFGRSGTTLIPLLQNVEKLEEQFKKLGLEISGEQIKDAAALTDAYNILSKTVLKLTGSIFKLFGSETAVLIERIASAINSVADALNRAAEFTGSGALDWLTPRQLQPVLRQWRRIEDTIDNATRGAGLAGDVFDAFSFEPEPIKLDPVAESLLKSATISGVGGGMTAEVVAPGKFFPADLVAGLDGLIAEQKTLITSLQRGGIADLPQALRQGSSAQISFLNRLNRVDEQKKANAIREKQLKEAEDAVEALEDLRTAILEGGQTGLVSIL